jgi:hypothetical protein
MLVGRIGRPGLLGTMARTAVVAGTATMTANALNRRSMNRAQEQQEAAAYENQQPQMTAPPVAAPAPAGGTFDDVVDQLTRLADLHKAGSLSDEEFSTAKQQLLAH